jgi:perosamine synthetase
MDDFLPVSRPSLTGKEEEYVLDALRSGWVSSRGPYIDALEASFAKYCGTRHAIAVSNGTTGLHLAIAALDIGPGDEVIVPDLTFIATANAVAYTGATPVIVDIEPGTLTVDIDAVERAITPRTKAIIPVHLYGHPADMDSLIELAKARDILVIEDAAEAHGATYKGRRVGGLGDCGVFSFYGNKIITTGEGGMLTTNDSEIDRRARLLRDHAMDPQRRYWHLERGFNYRMTNIQAALGLAQLEQIDEFLAQRRQIMDWYAASIATSSSVRLNQCANWAESAYWMVCLENDHFNPMTRQHFMEALQAQGIESRPYFHPISAMGIYESVDNPVSAQKSRIGINLPTYVGMTREDVARIAKAVNSQLTIA